MHHSSLLQALLAGLLCAQLASAGREPPAFIPLSNRNSKVAKDAQPLVPAQDLTPKYDTCFGNHTLYEDQGWFKLPIPVYQRDRAAALQNVVALLLNGGAAQPAQADAAAALDTIYARGVRFQAPDIARSRSHAGDPARLHRVMAKLLRGEPISVLILGGSIEAGADLASPPDSYFGQVAHWLNTTFPPSQGQHTFHNGGRSSTGSPFFARRAALRSRGLLGQRIGHPTPRAQKLHGGGRVLLQFDVNDGVRTPAFNNSHRRALEVLMRKLLQLPGAPAVVYLHWWSPTTNQGSRSFWNHTVEPESGTLAAYYSLPTLTLRNVWYPRWAANERGFLSRDVMCSINHPNYLGHQCARPGAAPYRYFADLIIALLQDHLAAAALVPALGGAPGAPAALPEPMLPGNHEANAGLVCLHDESLRAAAVPGNASARPSHARAVDPQLYSKGAGGFQWVDDLTHYGAHRWGWASEAPGEVLELVVDTVNPSEPLSSGWLSLAVVMSYKDMGAATLECVGGGCNCTAQTIDALWTAKLSIKEWWHVRVSPSPACALRFTARPTGRPGGARFKLDALTVRPESAMEGFFATDSHGGVVNLWASEVHHLYERSRTGQYGGAWQSRSR